MRKCAACETEMPSGLLHEYCQCPSCKSYMYVSDRSAIEENREYFNAIFKDIGSRQYDQKKQGMFEEYVHLDRVLRKAQYDYFESHKKEIMQQFYNCGRILEIGFGTGEHLYSVLRRGIEAYGIDISVAAVENFQNSYPEYADKVYCTDRFDQEVHGIYCCALFEHLDEPEQFIGDAMSCLNQNGILIIDGLPVLNEGSTRLTSKSDISFWKPCHRVIYSERGLEKLFSRNGLKIMDLITYDDYYYRVLSLHMKWGYRKIKELRDSCVKNSRLPGTIIYRLICRQALRINSLAYHGCMILKKS